MVVPLYSAAFRPPFASAPRHAGTGLRNCPASCTSPARSPPAGPRRQSPQLIFHPSPQGRVAPSAARRRWGGITRTATTSPPRLAPSVFADPPLRGGITPAPRLRPLKQRLEELTARRLARAGSGVKNCRRQKSSRFFPGQCATHNSTIHTLKLTVSKRPCT